MNSAHLRQIFIDNTPLIDVRAPVEFKQGHLPNAVNLPILNDAERALIGTVYKNEGNVAAVQLGHQLVAGNIKAERIKNWITFANENPKTNLYCFRGGQRSQITQKWLKEMGLDLPLIQGGYKSTRQFLIDEITRLTQKFNFIVLSGTTGAGKTDFLNKIKNICPVIDLEQLASHRGSAFGAKIEIQPVQVNFENQLSVNLLKLEFQYYNQLPLLVEDESRVIGKCIVPPNFFEKMRSSPVIWIDEPLENRVQNILNDYILNTPISTDNVSEALNTFAKYKKSLQAISKKLGGQRTNEIFQILQKSETEYLNNRELHTNKEWIEKLLVYYYDPLYLNSLAKRNVSILFKGSHVECREFLNNYA